MKKFLKVFVVALIIAVMPVMFACDKFKSNNKSYDLNFEFHSVDEGNFGQLTKVEGESNYYSLDLDENIVLYIDSHTANLLDKISNNTNVTLTFYLSPLSSEIEFLLNDVVVEYETSEVDGYQSYEFSFTINGDSTVCVNGSFFML